MSLSRTAERARRRAFGVESLESRALLTGGAGNTFALVPADIPEGGSAEVRFTISPENFQRPNGRVVLGVDVTPQRDSAAEPRIESVARASTNPGTAPARRFAGAIPTSRHPMSHAVLATLGGGRNAAAGAEQYTVRLSSRAGTSGGIVLGYYLPGDANGDGVVDQQDEQLVRQSIGATIGTDRYNFDADANRDGIINVQDLLYTRINRGVRTTISPVLSANLDPASDTGEPDRTTEAPVARFTGAASVGATITYEEIGGRSPGGSTVAGPDGNYQIDVGLAQGINMFRVSSIDSFGQPISGQISPVIRSVPVD